MSVRELTFPRDFQAFFGVLAQTLSGVTGELSDGIASKVILFEDFPGSRL